MGGYMDGTEFRSREEAEKPEEQPKDTTVEERHSKATTATEADASESHEVVPEINEPDTPVSELPTSKKKKHILFITLIAALVVLGVVFFVWKDQIIGVFVKQPVASQTDQTSNSSSTQDQAKITDPELARFITPTTGEVWYGTPKKMTPQGWFKGELASSYQPVTGMTVAQQMAQNAPTYTEVGTRQGNTIILVVDPYSGGPMAAYWLLEKRADGTVAIIVQPQSTGKHDDNALTYAKDVTTSKVTVYDETTHYDSISLPASISIDNGEVVTRPEYATLQSWGLTGNEPTTNKIIKQLGASNLVRVEQAYADTKLTNYGYYIATPLGTKIGLQYNPNATSLEKYTFTNDATLQYKSGDGMMVYDTIAAIARGCGGASAAVTRSDSLKLSQLTKIGTTDTGRAVYEITDKTAPLYTKAYQEYKDAYSPNVVSFEEYIKQHGLMVIENGAGELLVYVRSQYAMGGGCAKPVVYLYPTQTTTVSVRVGANVTVSDPHYTAMGWQGVVARQDGRLSYNGKNYDSLFWEGTGSGVYPGITSGTVVKRADTVATMKRQLTEQGLSVKETADFIAFWQDKIPNKPYIRLTWLNTSQMNTLAPLYVSPKPDTVIRVFLDMAGFDNKIELPAQKLTSTFRHGFTVVEWGGLTSEIRH